MYLIRHGETTWNRDKRIQGQTDIPLHERGKRQAEALAARLASIDLERIYTSDLGRAVETTGIIVARQRQTVPITSTPDLRECNYGLWEGLTLEKIKECFAEDWAEWHRGGRIGSPTGGEDFISLQRRAGRVFDAAAKEGRTTLISAHRGPLRAILCHALGLEPTFRSRFFVTNCSLSAIECHRSHRPRLILLNDTSHLCDPSLYPLLPAAASTA
ncbi:MAG: histidine phosphatase family protein [Deltaproteobacteria bacterium]|nr:histidine phosphatase family protein [Deltaproteobacteria bacterium]